MRLLHCCQHGRGTSSESQIMLNFPLCFQSLSLPSEGKNASRCLFSGVCDMQAYARALHSRPPLAFPPRTPQGEGESPRRTSFPESFLRPPGNRAVLAAARPRPLLVGGAAGVFLAAPAIKLACWLLNGHEEHRAVCVRPARPP